MTSGQTKPAARSPLTRRREPPKLWVLGSTPTAARAPEASASAAETGKVPDFRALYQEHAPFVWRYAATHGVPRSLLDDVLQEVFLVVHGRLSSFEQRSSIKTWIAGIAVNVVRSFRRRRKHRELGEPLSELDTVGATDDSACDALERKRARELLSALLERMSELQREAFVLCDLEQFPQVEVAGMLGVNENTLRARLRTARLLVNDATASPTRAREREGERS
jgi:RNA polymerase sigma-70 factor (ECF subfamily)